MTCLKNTINKNKNYEPLLVFLQWCYASFDSKTIVSQT